MSMPYRMNGPEEIDTKKLLLWPNNPRLKICDFSEVKYTDKQLLNSATQSNIFNLLSKHEDHDVQSLIQSMCKVGFMREKAPAVMKVKGAGRYLVLEGNRRLTAIKTILADKSLRISAANRKSLVRIPCWIFEHTSKQVPLKAAISRMVAETHIKGQKAHTKLQRAHMLYNAYEGFLADRSKTRGFSLDKDALAATADFFDSPGKELEGDLSVVRLYKQFIEAYEFEDIPQKCSERLSWVHKNPGQFKQHFGYDPNALCFDEEGLDRYYGLFLHTEAAVYNPRTFKKFLYVMRYGASEDIEAIRDEPNQLSEIQTRLKDQKSENRFLDELNRIELRLNALRISDFNKTAEEARAINRIVALVATKLRRLSSEPIGTSREIVFEPGGYMKPTNIQEAISLDYSQLTKQVIKMVKLRPNSTCLRNRVATLLLKEWKVNSRGHPRDVFCEYVDRSVKRMIDQGHLNLYKSKNERVRV